MTLARRRLLAVAASVAAPPLVTAAKAQTWPNRPISVIVPASAGGPTDAIARVLAEPIGARLGQTVLIDNVAGAATIATDRNLTYRTDTDRIWIAIEEADAPPLIASLVEAGINVFHAQRRTQSLEEMFLEATGGESVD